MEIKRHEEAVVAFNKVIELEPSLAELADVHFELACAYKAIGDTENTVRSLRHAFALDSTKRDLFKKVFPDLYKHRAIREALGFK
jgi:tetratricopeptide (TPR) repeat protein